MAYKVFLNQFEIFYLKFKMFKTFYINFKLIFISSLKMFFNHIFEIQKKLEKYYWEL